jgi:RNA polymerase sigma-70 factor (ECF subfamily)
MAQRSEKERVLDAYLVAAGRSGDRAALERLARRWMPKLQAHALRLCAERDLAADISQDAWSEILRGLDRLDNAEAFAAWAFRIVTHRYARSIRSLTRRRAGEQAAAREAELEVEATQEGVPELDRVRAAIARLPGPQRAALGLFYREGLRVAEIAVSLDIPVGTVKTRLMHARSKLRALLEGEHHEQDR